MEIEDELQQDEIQQVYDEIDRKEEFSQKLIQKLSAVKSKQTKQKISKQINDLREKIEQLNKRLLDLHNYFYKYLDQYVENIDISELKSNEKVEFIQKLQKKQIGPTIQKHFLKIMWKKKGTEQAVEKYKEQQKRNGRKVNDSFYKIKEFMQENRCYIPSNTNCFFKCLYFIFQECKELKHFLDQIYLKNQKPHTLGVSTKTQHKIYVQIEEEYQKIYNKKQFIFTCHKHIEKIKLNEYNKFKYIIANIQNHVCVIIRNRNYQTKQQYFDQYYDIENLLTELKIDQSIQSEDINQMFTKKEIDDIQKMEKESENESENESEEEQKYDKKQIFFDADFETMQKDENSNQQLYAVGFYTNVLNQEYLFEPKINLDENLFEKTPKQKDFYNKFQLLMKQLGDLEEQIQQQTILNPQNSDLSLFYKLQERLKLLEKLKELEDSFPSKDYEQSKRDINNSCVKRIISFSQKYEHLLNEEYNQLDNEKFQLNQKYQQQERKINYQIQKKQFKQQQIDEMVNQKSEISEDEKDEEEEEEEEISEEIQTQTEEEKNKCKEIYYQMQKDYENKCLEKRQKLLSDLNVQKQIDEQFLNKFGTEKEFALKIENYDQKVQEQKENRQRFREIKQKQQIIFEQIYKEYYEQVKEENANKIFQQYKDLYLGQNGIETSEQLMDTFLEQLFSFTKNFKEYNKKSVCYFHNGKAFDFYFILKNMNLQKYKITGLQLDGQQILTFTVNKKNIFNDKVYKTSIQFKCSTRIMSGSLKRISKDMKLSFRKIEIDSDVLLIKDIKQFEGEVENKIKEYLFFDVMSLAEALITFRNGLFESQDKVDCFNFQTISQIAAFIYKKYLENQGIFIKELQYLFTNVYQNVWLGEFPVGGRTNCYLNFFINSKKYKPFGLFYLDMNSLYPSAMRELCKYFGGYPYLNLNTKVLTNFDELITKFNNYLNSDNDEDFLKEAYLIECDIYQPLTQDFLFSNYQVFDENNNKTEKVYKCNFPEQCFVRQKFTNIDLFYIVKYNGAIVKKIHQCLFFPDRINLKHDQFVEDLTTLRNKYKAENNETCQLVTKLMTNSLFGKLIQKPIFEKHHLTFDIDQYKKKNNAYLKEGYIEFGLENQKQYIVSSEIHEMKPFTQNIADSVTGSFLLSFSKHMVNQLLVKTNSYKFDKNNLENFCYYSDTDSIIVGRPVYEKLVQMGRVGKKLGQIKLEHYIQPGTFESYGKKIYRYQNEFNEIDYRFKGLSFYNISKTQQISEEKIVKQCFDFMKKNNKKPMFCKFIQFTKDLKKQNISVKINEKVIQSTFQNEKLQQRVGNIIFFKNRLQNIQNSEQQNSEALEQQASGLLQN